MQRVCLLVFKNIDNDLMEVLKPNLKQTNKGNNRIKNNDINKSINGYNFLPSPPSLSCASHFDSRSLLVLCTSR